MPYEEEEGKDMNDIMMEINDLTKYYGDVKGVEDLSLKLRKGEIFGFIGPNGAGKSTTIRSVMNLINKTKGQVLINGKPFEKNDVETKRIIGYLPSEVHLYDDMTVKKIFDYHESFYSKTNSSTKKSVHDRREELAELLRIDESKRIEDLSLGNLKKVGIILALMHQPALLILDEPTSGLDPIMQNVFYDLLLEEKNKGTTIFYSTHILSEVAKICDRVGIIRKGKLIKVENVDSLSDKSLTFVTIRSAQVTDIVNELGVRIISEEKNYVRFANSIPDNELIKILSHYTIDKLLIEEATLEDIFFHYYTED